MCPSVNRVNEMFDSIRKTILTFDEAVSISSYNPTNTNIRECLQDPERTPVSVIANAAFRLSSLRN